MNETVVFATAIASRDSPGCGSRQPIPIRYHIRCTLSSHRKRRSALRSSWVRGRTLGGGCRGSGGRGAHCQVVHTADELDDEFDAEADADIAAGRVRRSTKVSSTIYAAMFRSGPREAGMIPRNH